MKLKVFSVDYFIKVQNNINLNFYVQPKCTLFRVSNPIFIPKCLSPNVVFSCIRIAGTTRQDGVPF